MKMLVTALLLAIVIAATGFTESADARAAARRAEPAAGRADRDNCLSGQNEKCYWRGYPLPAAMPKRGP
jgi:hypothetical protein